MKASPNYALLIACGLLLACLTASFPLRLRAAKNRHGRVRALQHEPTSTGDKIRRRSQQEQVEFEPLDVMLLRARKREINPMLRVQALWSAPLLAPIIINVPISRGDAVFVLLALALHAPGFAVGFVTAKLTARRLLPKGLPRVVVQFYPVLLALACDQVMF